MGSLTDVRIQAAAAALCLALGCDDRAADTQRGCERTEAAVFSVAEGLIAADNAHDIEGVLDHYTEDVTFITPEGALVEGKPRIRPRYEELFQAFVVDIEMEIEEVGLGEEWAFVRGRNVGSFTSKETRAVEALDDRFLMILRCEPTRTWRVSRLMWAHLDGPP